MLQAGKKESPTVRRIARACNTNKFAAIALFSAAGLLAILYVPFYLGLAPAENETTEYLMVLQFATIGVLVAVLASGVRRRRMLRQSAK